MTGREAATPTLDQRRARHAWDTVARAGASADVETFKMEAKRLPVRIVTAGLGHALAFLRAKGRAPMLLEALGDWVVAQRGIGAASGGTELINVVTHGDADQLRRATQEALDYLAWLNRFAEAELGDVVDEEP